MKLVLIALAVEISFSRLVAGSWGWAVGIVVLYCTFVYVRQIILIKNRSKNKSVRETEDTAIQGSARMRQKQLYDMPASVSMAQHN